MLRRRRQTKRLLRIARMLRELEAASPRPITSRRVSRAALGRVSQRRLLFEQPPECRRLEQAAPPALGQPELGEDRTRFVAPPHLPTAPLLGEPRAQLVEALGSVEDSAHDELRCDRPVPAVLLQAERDVVAAEPPEAVELRAAPERDCGPRVAAALAHTEAKMLPIADGR